MIGKPKTSPRSATDPLDELASLLIPGFAGLACLLLLFLLRADLREGEVYAIVLALVLGCGCLWSARQVRRAWHQRRMLLADNPHALAIGATLRSFSPTIGMGHLGLNGVVLAIVVAALGIGTGFGTIAGEMTGFLLSAPMFLLFPFDRYRRAIGGPGDAERGCRPVVFQAVAAPETLRGSAWRQLALYFGIANLVPLLLLLGYGLWRLERLGADAILLAQRPNRDVQARDPHPLQRVFRCSDDDGEQFRAGRLSRRQRRRVQRKSWLAATGTLFFMILAGLWTALALGMILVGGVWTSPDYGWGARTATAVALVLGLLFLIGLPLDFWRRQSLLRQDLRSGQVERLVGRVHRHIRVRHKDANRHWVVVDGQRFDIEFDVYEALEDGAVYALYQLPRSRRLLAILPAEDVEPAPRHRHSA